jgi:shikimate 5-dehydrogenase
MSGVKLALIGKNIQNSQSPAFYSKILKDQLLNYDLLDWGSFPSKSDLIKLISNYDGINITAPYKKMMFEVCHITSQVAKECSAVNCVKLIDGKLCGTLTDSSAADQIIDKLYTNTLPITILGDGSMSKMIAYLLNQKDISFQVSSRKQNWRGLFKSEGLFINTCLKEAIFPKLPTNGSIVLDLNYGYNSTLEVEGITYIDGHEMLELQGFEALNFLGIKYC